MTFSTLGVDSLIAAVAMLAGAEVLHFVALAPDRVEATPGIATSTRVSSSRADAAGRFVFRSSV